MNDPSDVPSRPDEDEGADATADFVPPVEPDPTVPTMPSPADGDESTSDLAESPTLGADAAFEGGASIGPYRLVRKLGQGGMGAVWEAVHIHLHKAVAVKVLSPRLMKRRAVVARFYREMRAAGRVTHPNVVQAYDAGEFGGVHFLAMELVDGVDLHRYVAKRGPLAVSTAARALRQAALGLAAAHAEGLVHRDMKPMNLLVSKSGRVKILDLGLARVVEAAADELVREGLTAEGHVMGTPDYMAPEQWEDPRTVGPSADLYSLGCTLFFLLTGKPPFGSERHSSAARKMAAHLGEAPPDLASARLDVPAGLDALYRSLVAKRPDDRPESAAALATSLAPFTKLHAGSEASRSRSSALRSPSGSIDLPIATAEDLTGSENPTGGTATSSVPHARAAYKGKAWAGCIGAAIGCACMAGFCLCSLLCAGLAAKNSPKTPTPEPTTVSPDATGPDVDANSDSSADER